MPRLYIMCPACANVTRTMFECLMQGQMDDFGPVEAENQHCLHLTI